MPTRTPCTGGRNGDPSFLICLNAPEAMLTASAPVERLFPVAGLVATAKRSRLAPSTVSLLVFLHEALPISRGLEVDSMLKSLDHDSDDSDEVMMMDES